MKREVLCSKGLWLGRNAYHNCFIRVSAVLMTNGEWRCLLTFIADKGFVLEGDSHKTISLPPMPYESMVEELSKTYMVHHVNFEQSPEKISEAMLRAYSM